MYQHLIKPVRDSRSATGVWNPRLARLSILDCYTFFLSFSSWISFSFGGTLFGSDFLLILGVPVLLTTRVDILSYKPVRRVLILGAFWLASQVVTDIIRHSALEDFARGWLKIIFTMGMFSILWVLIYNSKKRCVIYLVGLLCATVISIFVFKTKEYITDPWKFGWSFPTAIITLLWVTFMMRRRYSFVLLLPLLGLAAIDIYENFRSAALVLMITVVVTHGYKSLQSKGATLSKTKLASLVAVVLLVSVGTSKVYSYAASQWWLGEEAYKKYEQQANGAGGVLLGGRSEILSSSAAVADSPWIGHGSWAKDPKYLWIMVKRLRALGYYSAKFDEDLQGSSLTGVIPAHSHLMGAWVDAGLMGAVFWFYILGLLFQFFVTLNGREPFLPLAVFYSTTLAWDIFFSPFGSYRRFSVTFFLALLLAIRYQRERQTANSLPEGKGKPSRDDNRHLIQTI